MKGDSNTCEGKVLLSNGCTVDIVVFLSLLQNRCCDTSALFVVISCFSSSAPANSKCIEAGSAAAIANVPGAAPCSPRSAAAAQ